MKQTKVRVFVNTATENSWKMLENDMVALNDSDFKERYLFTKSGIRPYLNERLGIKKKPAPLSIPYVKPTEGYQKYTLQLQESTKIELENLINQLADNTGFEKRYISNYLVTQLCASYKKYID